MTITLNREESYALPFTINAPTNSLAGKRVTWVVEDERRNEVLRKTSAMPGSTAQVTVLTQTPSLISGTINILVADYASMKGSSYYASLWVDDGTNQQCATTGGRELVTIVQTVTRT